MNEMHSYSAETPNDGCWRVWIWVVLGNTCKKENLETRRTKPAFTWRDDNGHKPGNLNVDQHDLERLRQIHLWAVSCVRMRGPDLDVRISRRLKEVLMVIGLSLFGIQHSSCP